jgi:hypothetical protein
MASFRRGGIFGFALLAIVMLVVLLLVSRSWKATGARVLEVTRPQADRSGPPPEGTRAPADAAIRPSLSEAKEKTAAHGREVKEALAE